MKSPSKKKPAPPKSKRAAAQAPAISGWEDDPGSGPNPTGGIQITRPVPNLGAQPYALSIANPAVAPAPKRYPVGTAGFRYWAAAEALRRAADFWGSVVPGKPWQPGPVLPVDLEHGTDLNAFYDRVGLRFFKDTVSGRTVYSGESPDVTCHELGHAVLDSVAPGLWDVSSMEVGSFHESFGDMSSLLSALQLSEMRDAVLQETAGSIARSSRLSRLAEQLGWAIREGAPDAVDPDCLRNAANSFSYQDPATLPRSAPASHLCREVHSFSRVFTAAALDAMAGMLKASAKQDSVGLLKVSQDFARILISAVRASPVVTAFYGQVAAHAAAGANKLFPGTGYSAALNAAFVKHAILSPVGVAGVASAPAEEAAAAVSASAVRSEPQSLNVEGYGLGVNEVFVVSPDQAPRFRLPAPRRFAATTEPDHLDAARSYLEDLLSSGRVRVVFPRPAGAGVRQSDPSWRHTHELRSEGGRVVLRRLRVNCGFGACQGCDRA